MLKAFVFSIAYDTDNEGGVGFSSVGVVAKNLSSAESFLQEAARKKGWMIGGFDSEHDIEEGLII